MKAQTNVSEKRVADQVDTAGTVQYLHTDLVGSVTSLTDSTGALVATTRYSPYGTRTAHTGTADSNIGYTGAWTDPTTDLVHLRARDYDPATGQFLTIDPALDTTHQPYTYAANNPLQNTDPTGLCSFTQCLRVVGQRAYSLDEGFANGVTFGAVAQLDELISPGSTCTYEKDGFYYGGYVAGVAANVVLTDGLGETG